MRLKLSLIALAIICAKLPGATVTYTLSLNENASGQCAPGNFTLYGSVSKDDNFGLYAWAVDLKAAPDAARPTPISSTAARGISTSIRTIRILNILG